nr:PREDICTED: activating signal cointegrator 1 [Linepithema humile]
MEKWMEEKLSELLNYPVSDDLIEFIKKIENERDLDSFFDTFLDNKNPKHKQFVVELKKQRAIYNNQAGYRKTNDNDNVLKKQNDKKKGKAKGRENVQMQEGAKPEIKSDKMEKKKTKFVNILSHGDVLLKGRHKCDCEAKRHTLVNNCFNCGRIICKQENVGPCLFCGELVCYPDQQVILQSKSKQAEILYNKLMEQKPSKSLENSLKQRDKLLEFDRNSARRTKVIDDESDYYQSNSTWLTATEREKLQKQEADMQARKHASRLNKRIAIDFMGREIEENEFFNQPHTMQLEEFDEAMCNDFENLNVCPMIEFDRPTFIDLGTLRSRKGGNNTWSMESRVQDKEYLEMSDQGLCLSMHQPYASLLLAGIKIHEGRSWYSSHRGRLWIASAAKVPSAQEIHDIEHTYRVLKSEKLKFPETYPTGCLLGCVTVTNVLPQEEYKKLYPEGENDSPYVFICENAYTLPIYFPVKGKYKIYKMDKKLHQAASKYLEKAIKMTN